MAAVDALSLSGSGSDQDVKKWLVGGFFALAVHAAAIVYLTEAPPPHAGAEELPPIEMEMTPPPAGEAQPSQAAADSAPVEAPEQTTETPTEQAETPPEEVEQKPQEVEELPEIRDEETPPPPENETVATEDPEPPLDQTPPEETQAVEDVTPVETQQLQSEVAAIPPDAVTTPPDVDAAVTLPPEQTVVAREETPPPPPKPQPRTPPPPREVAKKEQPKPQPKREAPRQPPKPDARTAERPRPSPPPSAGARAGAQGVASNPGAARAASADYARRVAAILAGRKRYPAAAQAQRLSGRGTISFTVSRSGAVISSSISGTGSPILDQALRQMIQGGGFPPMPADMPGSSKSFSVPVNFTFRG